MVWKKVSNSDVGDADHFGGDDLDKVSDLFSGIDVDDLDINSDVTIRDQKLKFRNPANTFALTQVNPVITANYNTEVETPYSYLIYLAGSTCKRMNMATRAIESSGTTHDVVIQAAIDALGNGSGKSIFIKSSGASNYGLTASLNFTAINGNCRIVGEHSGGGSQLRPTGDFPALIVNKSNVQLDSLYFTHNQPAYTSSLLKIGGTGSPATLGQININDCQFYDFEHRVGTALELDASTTATDIVKVNCINNLAYGFQNSILATVGASPRFMNGNYFYNWQCWYPQNGLAVNIGTNGAFDNNNFFGFQMQGKVSAPNASVCGFDYETNNLGHCWNTSHHGCMVWDMPAGNNYLFAPASNALHIDLFGCTSDWEIGGAGATAGHVRCYSHDTVNRGISTQSGDATTKVFNIAHGLAAAPKTARVTPGSADAAGNIVVTKDATNVIVTYPVAPPTGTNNLVLNWEANVF